MFSASTASFASKVTELTTTFQSLLEISVPRGTGLSRVPARVVDVAPSLGFAPEDDPIPTDLAFVSSEGKASSKAFPTTVRNTTTPTTVPTTATMIAAIACPWLSSFRKRATRPRMKDIGSRTHPTMSAPGMQAKTNPTMDAISATIPRIFRDFFVTGTGAGI